MLYFNITFLVIIFMYDVILLLVAKEVIQPKMIVMIFPESDETARTG